jgi:hypothetical protein
MSQILATQDSVAVSTDNPLPVRLSNADIVQPMKIDSHTSLTVQTQNAVSIAASGWSQSSWFDCDGYDRLAFNVKNDGTTSVDIYVDWSVDGTNAGQAGSDFVAAGNTQQYRSGITDVKLRYARLSLNNKDGAVSTYNVCMGLPKIIKEEN